MTARLPVPGEDDGDWGDILNQFLEVSLSGDGTILSSALQQAGAVTTSEVGAASGVASLNDDTQVPTSQLGSGTASDSSFLRGDGTWAVPSGGAGSSTLAGDTDVSIASLSGGQVLTYDSSLAKWNNESLPTASTSVAGIIEIDGSSADIQPLGTRSAGSTNLAADAGHVHPTTGLALLSGASFTGGVNPSVVTLTYGGTIAVDAGSGNDFRVTLTGSGATIETPSGPTDGQRITFQITQDSTGSRTVNWSSGGYSFGTAGTPILSTAANLTDVIGFVYNAAIGQWLAAGAALGF